jgi:uncharacterized Tic20 family protein
METTADKNTSTLLQLSAFTQYFFPFGSFIFPTLIWSLKRNESEFVNYNGKQAINFQLSLLLYSLILVLISVPAILYAIFNNLEVSISNNGDWIFEQFTTGRITWIVIVALVAGFLFILLKAAEFFLIFYASVKNSNGETYDFPFTIKFLK